MNLIYNPLYSFTKYTGIKVKNRLLYTKANHGKEIEIMGIDGHLVFKELYLQDKSGKRKVGNAIFQVIFHSKMSKNRLHFEQKNFTTPFFLGLPGFCNKQFLINKNGKTFAGNYEWETVEDAKKYAHSFALTAMAKTSKPIPLRYQIIDKKTGKIVEKGQV